MKPEKRILNVLGHVDEAYIEEAAPGGKRGGTSAWRRWAALAACAAAVLCIVALLAQRAGRPPQPAPLPSSSGVQAPGQDDQRVPEEGAYHLIRLGVSSQPAPRDASDFLIYINQEIYVGSEQDGVYIIRPRTPPAPELPECALRIFPLPDTAPADAAALLAEQLGQRFRNVSGVSQSDVVPGLYLRADDGTAWDARQLDAYIVDDLSGGSYLLTASCFTEAAEGHGVRFTDMIATFEVVSPSGGGDEPGYLPQLRNTVDALIPALFSGQLSPIRRLLAEDAEVRAYQEDVTGDVSIRAIDYTVDDYEAPTRAVVSVKHRLGTEDSFNELTIELSHAEGRWLVEFAGIEK